MAREKDEPHRTYYVVVPYVATLIGGLAGNILFGDLAVVGYLVTGLGDAVGEPVGVRFGKHAYRVPSLASVKSVRSWEGSLAVFVMSVAAIAASIALLPNLNFTSSFFVMIPLIGLASAGVEAVSPHGWDNATMQIIPSFLAWLAL
jgi:phytol kinase